MSNKASKGKNPNDPEQNPNDPNLDVDTQAGQKTVNQTKKQIRTGLSSKTQSQKQIQSGLSSKT